MLPDPSPLLPEAPCSGLSAETPAVGGDVIDCNTAKRARAGTGRRRISDRRTLTLSLTPSRTPPPARPLQMRRWAEEQLYLACRIWEVAVQRAAAVQIHNAERPHQPMA